MKREQKEIEKIHCCECAYSAVMESKSGIPNLVCIKSKRRVEYDETCEEAERRIVLNG